MRDILSKFANKSLQMPSIDFDFNSPIESIIYQPFQDKGYTLHVKRDDFIHPFISGNKWRKLKYAIKDAAANSKSHLVTFGGAWSNHLLATAAASAKFGFRTTGYVRGEELDNPNLQLCRLFGMKLIFVDRERYKDKALLYKEKHENDEYAYFIDEGGMGKEALSGCAEIIDELPIEYDHIFCACGTGTTLAGLSIGLRVSGKKTQLHGVPVLAGGEFIAKNVEMLDPQATGIILHTNYHFGGYAKTKPELLDFVRDFVSQTGILIEPVYTGKVFYCLSDLVKQKYFKENARILVLHTGGIIGLLGKLDLF